MTAAEKLELYEAAETAILTGGQEYELPDGTHVERANLELIQGEIARLRRAVSAGVGKKRNLIRFKNT